MVGYVLWVIIFLFLGIFIYYVKNFIYFLFPELGRFTFSLVYLAIGVACFHYHHDMGCVLWFGASVWCFIGLHLYRKKKALQGKLLGELNKIAEDQNQLFEKMTPDD